MSGHSGWIVSVAFSPDGQYALSGSWDNTLKLWDISSGKEIRTLSGHSSSVESVAFSPDGKYALSGFSNKTFTLWDLSSGKEIKTLSGHSGWVVSVAFSPDGKYVLSGSLDKTLKLWDLSNGKEIKSMKGHSDYVKSVAFSPDGKYALSGSSDKTLKLWDLSSGKEIKTMKGHSEYVNSVAYSPDGKYALSGSDDNTLKLWNISSGKEIRTLSGHSSSVESVVFSPDGKYALSGSWDSTLKLWDLSSGKEIRSMKGHSDRVESVAFSPNGKYAISGSSDKTLKLWDLSSGKEIKTLRGHSSSVNSVAFSSDGKYTLSGSSDRTARIWEIVMGKEIVKMFSFPDGEWVSITPDGYFNASPNGAKNINVCVGMNVYSIDNFFETYFRPDIVSARLKSEDTTSFVKQDITKGIKTPPDVTIALKAKDGTYRELNSSSGTDYLIENGFIQVLVTAKDTGGGVKGVRLFCNGKVVGENFRGLTVVAKASAYQQEFSVPLVDGENNLRTVGFSNDMTESNPVTALVHYKAPSLSKPDMYLLVVSLNEYRNAKYNLNYCVADALGFAETITPKAKKIFNKVELVTISNRAATRAAVLKAFADLKIKIKPMDVFILFYAGHGIALDVTGADGKTLSEFYYILSDVTQMTSSAKCSAEGISGTEMRAMLADIQAGKQVLFIDACNSGAFANQFAARGAAEENALAKLSRATGSVIFASTTKDQFATEFAELKHGVFTFVVMEAFSGGALLPNGQLTVAGIKAYVDDKIPEYSLKYKGSEQYPTTFMWGQDFPIGMK
jgi:WD40 repeat protein